MQEKIPDLTMDIFPEEIKEYIISYLDTKSLCFFSQSNKLNASLSLPILKKIRTTLINRIKLATTLVATFCYTPDVLYVYGDNQTGELGLGHNNNCNKFRPVPLAEEIKQIKQVFPGYEYTLILTENSLYACGRNEHGHLGFGDKQPRNTFSKVPLECNMGKILQIAHSSRHILLLTQKGLYTCGQNRAGQLGQGDNQNRTTFTQVLFKDDIGRIKQVIVGGETTSFLLTDKGLYACGYNDWGQLGLGDKQPRNIFTQVLLEQDMGQICQIVASGRHTLLLTDKGLYTCGQNRAGQLGQGDNQNRTTFTQVLFKDDIGRIKQVIVGGETASLLLTDKGLYACGKNEKGKLGVGDRKERNIFTKMVFKPSLMGYIPDINDIKQIFVCDGATLILENNRLYACGSTEYYSLLGMGYFDYNPKTFVQVPIRKEIGEIWQVVTSGGLTLLLTNKGLYCCDRIRFNKFGVVTNRPHLFEKINNLREINLLHKLESYINKLEGLLLNTPYKPEDNLEKNDNPPCSIS